MLLDRYILNRQAGIIIITVIAFAISAMPEGLPLALTMALAIASNRMAKQNVIVRKLKAAESLGSCTVIASDKTGTLTINQQTAKKIILPNNEEFKISGTGYSKEGKIIGENIEHIKQIGFCGALNNEADISSNEPSGDSIDIAFLILAAKMKISVEKTKILETIPYESENKYSAVFYEKNGETYCTVKGSPETIVKFCNKTNFSQKCSITKIKKQSEALATDGYRVIAIANGKIPLKKQYGIKDIKNLSFLGQVGFIDPVRKEAVSSIRKCHKAGIKVLMITGDHPLTSFSIARDLKLTNKYDEVTTGDEVERALKSGKHAFDGTIVQKMNMPTTMEYIDDEAFINTSLVEVNLRVTQPFALGENVFSEIHVTRLNVPAAGLQNFKKDPKWGKFGRITPTHSYWTVQLP